MKKILFFFVTSFFVASCCAQNEGNHSKRNPQIFYNHLAIDSDVSSDELLLLYPDSSFYIQIEAPMVRKYSMGKFVRARDSLYLTSYQKIDTLRIMEVQEFRDSNSSSTIVVFNENNDTVFSRFIINESADTIWSDPENMVVKYDGNVREIMVSVGQISHFSRYVVRSPYNNVFHIKLNSVEKRANESGSTMILERDLFLMDGDSLIDEYRKRRLYPQTSIPEGVDIFPFSRPQFIDDILE